MDSNLREDLSNLEVESSDENIKKLLKQVKDKAKTIITQRAIQKRSVTLILNKIESEQVDVSAVKLHVKNIEEKVKRIEEYDAQIINLYESSSMFDYCEDICNNEIDSQTQYHYEVNNKVSECTSMIEDLVVKAQTTDTQPQFTQIKFKPKVHEVSLPIFKGNQSDVLQFSDFLRQFDDLIGDSQDYTDSTKLIYLKSYLRGSALDIIKHLSNQDSNYQVALNFLKKEFLDDDVVVDKHLKKLVKLKPPAYNNLDELRDFFNQARSSIYELKNFDLDVFENNKLGNKLLSFILCEKLPSNFKFKLGIFIKTDYPTIEQLLDNYNDVIKSLQKTVDSKEKRYESSYNNVKPFYRNENNFVKKETFSTPSQSFNIQNSRNKPINASSSNHVNNSYSSYNCNNRTGTIPKQNLNVTTSKPKFKFKDCKLCDGAHSMLKCPTYITPSAKQERLKQLNMCIYCSGSHSMNECVGLQNNLTFECFKCHQKSHITALCTNLSESQNRICMLSSNNLNANNVILPSTSAIIINKTENAEKVALIKCMVDPGSQSSYISEALRDKLNMSNLPKSSFELKTFIGSSIKTYEVATCDIHITPKNKVSASFLVDPSLNLNYKVPGMCKAIENLKGMGYKFADSFYNHVSNDDITNFDCLIGSDLIPNLTPLKSIPVMKGTVYSVPDGIIPFGPVENFLTEVQIKDLNQTRVDINSMLPMQNRVNFILNPKTSYFNPLECCKNETDVDINLENMFKLESIGITDSEIGDQDMKVVQNFKDGIDYKDERYYVNIPFKESIDKVPSNHAISLATMNKVEENLKSKGLYDSYSDIFQKQLELDIIETIDINPSEYTNYVFIPHHPVIRDSEQVTTKIRAVFNCSLKANKHTPSINEATHQGIDLLTSLLTLILKFRINKFVLLGDIEKAFLQIFLKSESDKNKFCFFWRINGVLKVFRFRTILFGLIVSPFILNYIIKYHLSQFENNVTVKALLDSFYVDNFIYTTSNVEVLKKVYQESQDIMQKGGFSLRSWNTNNTELKQTIKEDGKGVEHNEIYEKVLGYHYDPELDTIKLSDYDFNLSETVTKRQVLSMVSKVFDPLSLVLPVTIRGRLLMKSIWDRGIDWDETVHNDLSETWINLRQDLLDLKPLTFPRQTCDNMENEPVSINIFADGSKLCYGFCLYLVSQIGSNLSFAKGKVANDKRTIPQTELLSVYLALKCLSSILSSYNDLNIQEINLWSDSQIVLEWIMNAKDNKPKVKFTKNRVQDIKDFTKEITNKFNLTINFRYINTLENPADLITRGMKLKEFVKVKEFWLKGPHWLTSDKKLWPRAKLGCLSEEVKKEIRSFHIQSGECANTPEPIFDIKQFSNVNKLYRITEYVFKFINKTLKRNVDSHAMARNYWLKIHQNESFKEEIDFLTELKKGNDNNLKLKIPKLVQDLNLFLDDDGLLKCKGRIGKVNFYSYAIQNPILLSKTHYLTKLLIEDQHKRSKHMGLGTTLTGLRERGYWIPSGRQVVKSIIKSCVICQKLNAFSFNLPKLTNLPKERVHLIKPYDNLAIDYTGHIFVKNSNDDLTKMYIVLYTCLALRCVHLDVVPDLTLQSFLGSFRRFCSQYRVPTSIFTDNGSYFEASRPYLSKALLSDDFSNYLKENSIIHKTIPLYASWVGGVYERQIKTVKQCLYKAVGRSKLTYFQLITILSEIENTVNNRPLTYVNSDLDDIEPLTPNKILKVYDSNKLVFANTSNEEDPLWTPSSKSELHENLNETLSREQKIYDNFKNMWYNQYLLGLRENSKDVFEVAWQDKLRIGSIVLVESINKPRPYWIMGRIVKLIYGNDGKVRSVFLKQGNREEVHRSVNHLFPLEIQSTHLGEFQPNYASNTLNKSKVSNQNSNKSNDIKDEVRRPKREAATKARQQFKSNESLDEADFEGFKPSDNIFNQSSEDCNFEGF